MLYACDMTIGQGRQPLVCDFVEKRKEEKPYEMLASTWMFVSESQVNLVW